MDFIKNMGGGKSTNSTQTSGAGMNQEGGMGNSGSSGGGFMDKINSSMGGGKSSEANEDYLDKGVDFVQERFMGQGPQNNESAFEQAKDEQISDAIRRGYKSTTGRDFPVQDK